VIQAMERDGLVRTLAEPTLTAISGESAKFLAGGEFPIRVGSTIE
jgi:pilus assembly protein CpaC